MPFRHKRLSKYWAAPEFRGIAPKSKAPTNSGAQPPPQIGRQSRDEVIHRLVAAFAAMRLCGEVSLEFVHHRDIENTEHVQRKLKKRTTLDLFR